MSLLFAVAFAGFAVLDWVAVGRARKDVEYIAKPAALVALLCHAATGARGSAWLLSALGASLLGDVYLMLPGDFFLAGLAAFLVAHLAYVVDLGGDLDLGARGAWLAVVLLATAPIAARLLRAIPEVRLRAAVAVYMLTIALMVASAIASGIKVAAAGALLFLVSDALIAWNRFVRPLPRAQLAIMVTYHLGQLGLVTALR